MVPYGALVKRFEDFVPDAFPALFAWKGAMLSGDQIVERRVLVGRLRFKEVIDDREHAARILRRLGLPTQPPIIARARAPTDDDCQFAASWGQGLVTFAGSWGHPICRVMGPPARGA